MLRRMTGKPFAEKKSFSRDARGVKSGKST